MISVPAGVRIHPAPGPTDVREGFDGPALLAQGVLRQDPFSGHLFLPRGERADGVKPLHHDRDGLRLFAERLDQGRFTWPSTTDAPGGVVALTPAQLSMLLEGLEWGAPVRPRAPAAAG